MGGRLTGMLTGIVRKVNGRERTESCGATGRDFNVTATGWDGRKTGRRNVGMGWVCLVRLRGIELRNAYIVLTCWPVGLDLI